MKAFLKDYDGINEKLKNGLYAEPALVPESPWLGKETPAKPQISAMSTGDDVEIKLNLPKGEKPWQWLVRIQTTDGWKSEIVPGDKDLYVLKTADGAQPKAVIVSAISRLSREGKPCAGGDR